MKKLFLALIILLLFISLQISGQTWSGLTRLTWNTGVSDYPSIAVDTSDKIHVVWEDNTLDNYYFEIYYKRSTDGGSSWSGVTRLTWSKTTSTETSIAADTKNGIHVVWRCGKSGNYEIYYKRSTDGGSSWSGLTRLTWNSGWSASPSIVADIGSGIHVVWHDFTPGNAEIYYKRSLDSGATWSGVTRLTWNTGNSFRPSIAADTSGGIHVVWHDSTPGNDEIFYRRSTDSGTEWSALTRLSWNTGNSSFPAIAADTSSGIHVVWEDDTVGDGDIFYTRSTNSGATWTKRLTQLTWNAGKFLYPSIAADSGSGIHLVWADDRMGDWEIFYKQSTDSGGNWSGVTRLTWNAGDSWRSRLIAVNPGVGLHVVWEDNTPGNYEIFYKNRK